MRYGSYSGNTFLDNEKKKLFYSFASETISKKN